MYDAMIGAMRINRWYNDETNGGFYLARQQLYAWARVHAAEWDTPLSGSLYATLLVASSWESAMVQKCEHGEYLTTKLSAYLHSSN